MKKLFALFIVCALISGASLNGQKVKFKSGSLGFLKGQTSLLVKYDYSNMAVGKYSSEDDYIAKKSEDYNKKEAGKGDRWKEAWYNDRQTRFEPKFEELLNSYTSKVGLTCSQTATDAEYEMIVHTVFTEPGFNVGVMRQNAYIDAEISFRKIADGAEVALMTFDNCPGRDVFGYDFDTALRIEEAYAKLGKSLAGQILKAIK
ncbi:MAG: hypothetical protein JW973_14045 [Bacteroidales bacterium]|nr:hypothetical protein [Bacteroidales bacterium]